MKIRIADYVAWRLSEEGVKNVFLLSGGGMMHLLDGLARNDKINVICNHHEQCSGIAAESNARLGGGVGVCYATSGPGATNINTAVAGAWLDSVPVVFITGQSKVSQTIRGSGIEGLRQYGMFEVDVVPTVRGITKMAHFVDRASDVPRILELALSTAKSGRPGPVLLDFPLDVQGAVIEIPGLSKPPGCRISRPGPSALDLQLVIDAWKSADRPLILAGHGVRVADAALDLRELAQASGTPVVTTPLAKDVMPYSCREFIGHPGPKGDRAGNFALQTADLIISIGSSYHVSTTGYELDKFAPMAKKIQVDLDQPNFMRESVGVALKVFSGVSEFISAIKPHVTFGASRFSGWHQRLYGLKIGYPVSGEPHQIEPGRINIYKVMEILSQKSKEHTVFVADAGSAFYAVGQGLRIKEGQRVLVSGGFGAMGWALPAATGAACADDTKHVIVITGDGSLQTNVHELAVQSGNRLKVSVIVLNNNSYVSIKNTQDAYFGGLYAGVDRRSGVHLPELKLLAAAYGIPYRRIASEEELSEVIDFIYSNNGPALIDVQTNVNQEIIPTVSAKRLDDGRMQSMPLHVMSPFLPDEVQNRVISELTAP